MLTQHYLSFLVIIWWIIDLHYHKYYHLLSNISSKFQSSMTIFHHKLLTREGIILVNVRTHPSSMTIFVQFIHEKCHLKSYHSDTECYMTLTIIFSVVYFHLKDFLEYECELYLKQPLTPS